MSNESSSNPNLGLLTAHYKANFSLLVKRMSRRAGTEWDAEDAVQDAYERAIKYYAAYDPERSNFGAWFGRILRNAVNDHLNGNKGIADLEFDEELADGTPCEQYTKKVAEEISQLIRSKRDSTEEILLLFFECGYSAKDISFLVDGTKTAIHQTILRFRKEIANKYRQGGSLEA